MKLITVEYFDIINQYNHVFPPLLCSKQTSTNDLILFIRNNNMDNKVNRNFIADIIEIKEKRLHPKILLLDNRGNNLNNSYINPLSGFYYCLQLKSEPRKAGMSGSFHCII